MVMLRQGGQPFDHTQGHESLDVALDHESFDKLRTMSLSNGLSNGPGDDDIKTYVALYKDLFYDSNL